MNSLKILAIVLIVAGVFGLVHGSFSYTKNTHQAKLGPIEMSVKDKQTVNVPGWAGVGGIVVGGALLLFSRGERRTSSCIAGVCVMAINGTHYRQRHVPDVVREFRSIRENLHKKAGGS